MKLSSWDDFEGRDCKVSYICAYFIVDKQIRKRIKPSNIYCVKHWKEGLRKLHNKNVDIHIDVERTILAELKGKETAIRAVGRLDSYDLYPYFNKNHKTSCRKTS